MLLSLLTVPVWDAAFPRGCVLGEVVDVLSNVSSPDIDIVVEGNANDWLLVWVTESGEFALRLFHGDGGSETTQVLERSGVVREPALARLENGWLLVWAEAPADSPSAFQIWASVLTTDGSISGAPTQLTNSINAHSQTPQLLSWENNLLLTWIERELDGTSTQVLVQPVESSGVLSGESKLVSDEQHDVSALALSEIGSAEAIVSYVARESSGGLSSVYFRRIDSRGDLISGIELASGLEDAFERVHARWGDPYSAIFYDVVVDNDRNGVRLRRIDENGAMVGETIPFSETSLAGQTPSAVSLLGGYAVVWRAYATARRQLRFALLDRDGNTALETQLISMFNPQGRTALARNDEGSLFVVWTDTMPDGKSSIKASRVLCSG